MTYTFTEIDDGATPGTVYAFKTRAVNSKGESEFSIELLAAMAAPIDAPDAPTRNMALSTRQTDLNETTLRIEWTESSPTEIEVQGYALYAAHGTAGSFEMIYDGR